MDTKNGLLNNEYLIKIIFFIFLFLASLVGYASTEKGWLLLASLILFIVLVEQTESLFGYPFQRQTQLANRSLNEAIENIALIIQKAEREIIIVSGHLSHKVYDHPKIINIFKEKLPLIQDGKIKVNVYITEQSIDSRTAKILEIFKLANIDIKKIEFNKGSKINHFIITDSRHVRLEERHSKNSNDRKALLHFSNPYLAKKTKALLDNIISKCLTTKINY